MLTNQQASPELSSPEQIRDILHSALVNIGNFEQCALLDYPSYLNIGDHLIWLGTIFYLTDVLKTKINYAASIEDFSDSLMEQQIGKAPILFQGGGNFGDLWPRHQNFREQIVSKYKDRPIFILPQSIYFEKQDNLLKAADIFNSHPNLTLFIRDNYSYELAQKYFSNCQVIKTPDMAFQMVNMPELSFSVKPKHTILYHCREDSELNQNFATSEIKLTDFVVQDWVSYKWLYRGKYRNFDQWYWRIPGMVKLVREGWQRGLSHPLERISRYRWENSPTYTAKFNKLYHPTLHHNSWSLMHSGMFQLKRSRLVITNRLHGHILCLLLGIPHIFLPNAHHKNQAFYHTWTQEIPFCQFIEDAAQIPGVVQEFLGDCTK